MKPILFKTEMIRAILDGKKTQTRRPDKTGTKIQKYRIGNIIPACDEHNNLFAQIEIKNVYMQFLQSISPKEIIKEGILNIDFLASFINLWNSCYEERQYKWDENPFVFVYEFKIKEIKK